MAAFSLLSFRSECTLRTFFFLPFIYGYIHNININIRTCTFIYYVCASQQYCTCIKKNNGQRFIIIPIVRCTEQYKRTWCVRVWKPTEVSGKIMSEKKCPGGKNVQKKNSHGILVHNLKFSCWKCSLSIFVLATFIKNIGSEILKTNLQWICRISA